MLKTDSVPQAIPLQFSGEKKLEWDTIRNGGVKPVEKHFDLETLPSVPLATPSFLPLPPLPATVQKEVKFSYDSLPTQQLDVDKLQQQPLSFTSRKILITERTKVQASEQNGQPLSIYSLSAAQGFPAFTTTAFYQDKSGIIWIGSSEGLFRYDGHYVETIFKGQTNAIAGINEDEWGNIWYIQYNGVGMIDLHRNVWNFSTRIGSATDNLGPITKDANGRLWLFNQVPKGMVIIDPKTLTFQRLSEKKNLVDTSAYQALQDDQQRMWVSTYGSGIHIVDPKSKTVKTLNLFRYYRDAVISGLEKDDEGNIWVAGYRGAIYQVNTANGIIRQHCRNDSSINFVFGIKRDDRGRLWLQTTNGIKIIDVKHGTYRRLSIADGFNSSVNFSLLADNKHFLWLATSQGLNIVGQQGDPAYYLPNTSIISMMEDHEGHMWVGTQEGMQILDFEKKLIRNLDFTNELGTSFIQSFYKTPEGLIVATNGGISTVDFKNKRISYIGKRQGFLRDTIYIAFKDKDKSLWVSGPRSGIEKVDSTGKWLLHTGKEKGLNDLTIQDIKQDSSGQIWIATNSGGINVYNPSTGVVKYLNNLPGLWNIGNRMLLSDKYGRIWIGTNKGIYIADAKAGTITNINTKHGLTNNLVLSLLVYKGNVIVGTSNKATIIRAPVPEYAGGKKENATQWKIEPMAFSEGFIRRNKNAWSTDAITSTGRYFWGDNGISVINTIEPEEKATATYITGLSIMGQQYRFTSKYSFKESDTLYEKDTFYLKGQIPQTNEATKAGIQWDSVAGPYSLPAGLRIRNNQNYLQFQFNQANLISKDTAWFMYVLEGIDKQWNGPTSNTFSENYLNLSPGFYTFKVSSKGADGKWSEPVSYSFTISPPWYQTWWAYTIFSLAIVAILRAYIVYRSKRLRKEKKLLEEKVAQRTEELNKSLESLKQTQAQLVQSEKMASLGELTAGIAHEIQNPLNFVNNFSDVSKELLEEMEEALQQDDKEEALAIAGDIKGNLEKIAFHGKRADGIVKGMLQHSRTSTGKKEPIDMNALIDEYLRLSYHGLRAKDKTFNAKMETHFDENVGKADAMPQELGRVLLNLFNNAFYAVTEKKRQLGSAFEPTIWVSTIRKNNAVEIVVKDNGTGIPQKVLEKIYQPFFTTKPTGQGTGLGLSMSYDIITKAHGGELKVESREGEGATFIIILPTVLS